MVSSSHRAGAAGGLSPSTFDEPQSADTSAQKSQTSWVFAPPFALQKNLPAWELTVAAMSYSGHARPGYAIDLIRTACWRHDGPPARRPASGRITRRIPAAAPPSNRVRALGWDGKRPLLTRARPPAGGLSDPAARILSEPVHTRDSLRTSAFGTDQRKIAPRPAPIARQLISRQIPAELPPNYSCGPRPCAL